MRIYPPYLIAWLIACLVIYLNTFYPTWYSKILVKFNWDTAISFLYMFRLKVDYYNLAWWSLQIELLFYFLVPIIYYYRRTILKGIQFKWLILVTLGIVSILLQIVSKSYFPQYYSMEKVILSTFMFLNYIICFFMGVSIAANFWEPRDINFLAPIGITFIVISKFSFYSISNIGYALVYGSLIIYLLNYKSSLNKILNNKYLIWFGERSYSFFLTHFSLFYLSNYIVSYYTTERSLTYGITTRILGWTLSLFVGLLVFELVEKKFSKNLKTKYNLLPF